MVEPRDKDMIQGGVSSYIVSYASDLRERDGSSP